MTTTAQTGMIPEVVKATMMHTRQPKAKAESSRDTEAKVKAAADKINLKVESAQGKIREALASARSDIESVAAEATQEMVRRVAGLSVDKSEAAAAVKAELNV